MSFLNTLQQMGLLQTPAANQAEPSGGLLDPTIKRDAAWASLGNIGGQILALSQPMTSEQRARMMAGADWSGGFDTNLYNAAQMKIMQDAAKRKQQEDERGQQARAYLLEQIRGAPDGPARKKAEIYAQLGDYTKAAEAITGGTGEPPQMKTVRSGDKDVTYQWDANANRWVPFSEGLAFKPTPDTTVNVGTGSDDFDKKLMGGVGEVYVKAMEAGGPAAETKTAVMQLRELLQQNGGALDGFAATITPYLPEGFVPEGANDLVAAQSIVAGLIPKQRVPGSGATSDYDARMFAQSLPSIWNKPGANAIILDTLEAYSDYRIAVSNIIADVASDPSIANKSGAIRDAIAQLPDPFVQWKKARAALGGGAEAQVPAGGKGSPPEGVDLESALGEYN